MFDKPSLVQIAEFFPLYLEPEYQDQAQAALNSAYRQYGSKINDLPVDDQIYAMSLAVCHTFAKSCWNGLGYSGAPTELKSRNSSVRFALKGSSELNGSICGQDLSELLSSNTEGSIHASVHSLPTCGDCSCH